MEFHIHRELRERLDVDDQLFSYTGNVVFANVTACRVLAQKMNEAHAAGNDPEKIVNAGALFAMGLIDELNHALVERYRKEIDPNVLKDAVKWFTAHAKPEDVERMIRAFAEQFPSVAVYRGQITVDEWLGGTTDGLSNREAAVEEMMMLWLANSNPAFKPFKELFEDTALKEKTVYQSATTTLPGYFATRPPLAPEVGSLLDALRAPFAAAPDSLTGQLEFIREKWAPYIGDELKRILLAIDVLREEDIAIWLRFHPPGPDWHRHGQPGRGNEGFAGDEYIGFEDEWITDAQGRRRRRYAHDYQTPLQEYEAFSADQAWMPNVVLMAKSTYVWLEQLSKKYKWHIYRLDHVPDEELRLLAERGITGLWLIGLWERSVASRTIKRLRGGYDAVASAYSLKEYEIAQDLGGNAAYENLRDRAARFGLRLASDMVPNHMGIDSPWVIEHPDWFISRWESPFPAYSFNGPDLSTDSRVEIKIDDHYYDQSDAAVAFRVRYHNDGSTRYIYHGNDGTTFAWNDTAQLDYSKAHVREHVIQVILHVARLFPIIRFDAAMVLAKRHVQRLWFPLPGAGGSIPSRAENAMSQEDFDALMPHEFWREVVDRVATEVPGTLLLAEAFWLLESYFVRTLGMHRVYNSAFMNMLRDEENAKYRSYLKKTIEFDPDILKRYVNFMSNPDERTAIDQFGSEDKYFGVCTLLATLPGLPMFGHGQIEGYTERYGMEFKQAKMDEWPNEHLVARHMREIAPLLKRRYIFAESWNFVLYDFWTGYGTVNENVFAYSNRLHGDRSIVLYNNAYVSTSGTIHISAASMDKGSGELRQRSLSDALGIPMDDELILVYRDASRGLEYLKRAGDFHRHGLSMELRGYQYAVLLDWREFRHSEEWPWGELCDSLHGAGVPNADEALWKLKLRPVHEALRWAIDQGKVLLEAKDSASVAEAARKFASASDAFFARAGEAVDVKGLGLLPMGAVDIAAERKRALKLPEAKKPTDWTQVAAWMVLRPVKLEVFDQLMMRAGLADIFTVAGLHGKDAWRAAARVRLLLHFASEEKEDLLHSRRFWDEPDVRWLASVNEAAGKTYFNQEAFAELAEWMQVPRLLDGKLTAVEAAEEMLGLSNEAEAAGYELGKFMGEVEEGIAEDAALETVEREEEVDLVEEEIEEAGEDADEEPAEPKIKA
jgi:glycosidase